MLRYSEYKFMWIIIGFDLPTDTAKERKAAYRFRQDLLDDGFQMLQFSIYSRSCDSYENADVHVKRMCNILPEYGNIFVLVVTEAQYKRCKFFFKGKPKEEKEERKQKYLF